LHDGNPFNSGQEEWSWCAGRSYWDDNVCGNVGKMNSALIVLEKITDMEEAVE
jgi:hypothetical protein